MCWLSCFCVVLGGATCQKRQQLQKLGGTKLGKACLFALQLKDHLLKALAHSALGVAWYTREVCSSAAQKPGGAEKWM